VHARSTSFSVCSSAASNSSVAVAIADVEFECLFSLMTTMDSHPDIPKDDETKGDWRQWYGSEVLMPFGSTAVV
jgi:hypothetical protein